MATNRLIAVSGSSGLIGSTFQQLTGPPLSIIATAKFSHIAVSSIEVEIQRLANLGVESLLHLAWPAGSQGADYRFSRSNFVALEQTLFVKRACQKYGVGFVGVGTGVDKQLTPATEYSLAKFAAREIFLEDILSERISWVRPFFVFDSKSWPRFVHDSEFDPIVIKDDSPRDFIHLEDVATGFLQVMLDRIMGEIDLGTGVLRRPSDLCRALGKDFIVTDDKGYSDSALKAYPQASRHPILGVSWSPSQTMNFFNGGS